MPTHEEISDYLGGLIKSGTGEKNINLYTPLIVKKFNISLKDAEHFVKIWKNDHSTE